MMGISHRASGIAAGLGLGAYLDVPLVWLPAVVAATAIGSLVPDIDCKGSMASRSIPVITPILSWVARRTSKVVYHDSKGPEDEPYEGTHRHLTHTAVFAAVLGAVLYLAIDPWLGSYWGLVLGGALALGCLVHDMGDSLTIMGCPFLWPLPIAGETWAEIRPPAFLRFRTGGWFERLVMFPALMGAAVLLVPGVWPVVYPFLTELIRTGL